MTIAKFSRRRKQAFLLGVALIGVAAVPQATLAKEKIFEINVTNDLNLASGEPMIGVDPKNPNNLAVIEMTLGSKQRPVNSYDQQDYKIALNDYYGTMGNAGRVLLSKDGGKTWTPQPPPTIGGDPYLAYGPKSEIYAGAEGGHELDPKTDLARLAEFGEVGLSVSTDGGGTFSKFQSAGTPINRPWLSVDWSNGKVYTVSSGLYDATNGRHNARTPAAISDRWLVTWGPQLTSKSEPRRLGGPDFSASGGSTIATAHGVVAATFVLGGPPPGQGAAPPGATRPIPPSLQAAVGGRVNACSTEAPCLFFETTTDDGRSWARHYVPVTDVNGQRVGVVADPKRPGRYTISGLTGDKTNVFSMRTADSGKTWSKPVFLPQVTKAVKFKQWMAMGPSGVVGLIWKDRRDDLTSPEQIAKTQQAGANRAFEHAFDVYSSISCDGGTTWTTPLRVNGETSPAGPPGSDDFAYLALDAKNAHLVWGDRRLQPTVVNVPGAAGGVQTFYGKLPFTLASKGKACRGG